MNTAARPGGRAWQEASWGAFAAAALTLPWLPAETAAFAIMLGALAAMITAADWRSFIVPNHLNLALFGTGVAFRLWSADVAMGAMGGAVMEAVVHSLTCGATFLLVRRLHRTITGREGLGLGDVKFAAAAAPWIGAAGFPWVVLMASIAGIAYVGAAAPFEGWRRARRIPFASFLAPALFLCWLVQAYDCSALLPLRVTARCAV